MGGPRRRRWPPPPPLIPKDGWPRRTPPLTGEWKLAPVREALSRHYQDELIELEIEGERIEVSAEHPFWVAAGEGLFDRPDTHNIEAEVPGSALSGRWVEAQDLRAGDWLICRSQGLISVQSVRKRLAELSVFNLHVLELQSYTVGKAGVWVHNSSGECNLNAPKSAAQVRKFYDKGGKRYYKNWSGDKWKSIRTGELKQKNGKWVIEWPDGTTEVANGKYAFVTKDGKTLVGARPKGGPQAKHIDIAEGGDVNFAGEVDFYQGAMNSWDAQSGHYLPEVSHNHQAGLPIDKYNDIIPHD